MKIIFCTSLGLLIGITVLGRSLADCFYNFPGTTKFQKGIALSGKDTMVSKIWTRSSEYNLSNYVTLNYYSSDSNLFSTLDIYQTKRASFKKNYLKDLSAHAPNRPDNNYLTPFDSIKIENKTLYFVRTLTKNYEHYSMYAFFIDDKTLCRLSFRRLKLSNGAFMEDTLTEVYIKDFVEKFIRHIEKCN